MTARDTSIALGVVLMWSLNLILQKIAVGYVSVYLVALLRCVITLPFLLLYPKVPEKMWRHALCGFFLVALYLILFSFGLKTDIGAGLSAFVLQFQVFFVILCCFLLLGEKPRLHQTLGILVACAGVYFLHTTSTSAELPFLGVVFLIGSCLSLGIGVAFSKKYELGNSMGDVVWLTALASPFLLSACLIFDGPAETLSNIIHISPIALACIVFATLASTLLGVFLWLNLIQRHSAASVVPFMLLIPIFSGGLSYFVFGETLSSQQIVSGFIIILGVMLAQKFHKRVFGLIFRDKSGLQS